jgi:dTDP-4-dehydrorhamnose 3,5-epimerase
MIEGVLIKRLNVIKDSRGRVMEILRRDDKVFQKFGQVYLSTCNPGIVKGWHYHKKQTDFFAVVQGNAKVVLYDMQENSKTKGEVQEVLIGENNPILIQIPPMVVHAITSTDKNPVFLINCPTQPYNHKNPDEYRLPLDSKEIPYTW